MFSLNILTDIGGVTLAILGWWLEILLVAGVILMATMLKKESVKTRRATVHGGGNSIKRNISRSEEWLRIGIILAIIVLIAKILYRIGGSIVAWFKSVDFSSGGTWWTIVTIVIIVAIIGIIFQSKWKGSNFWKIAGRIALVVVLIGVLIAKPWKSNSVKENFYSSIEKIKTSRVIQVTPTVKKENDGSYPKTIKGEIAGYDTHWGENDEMFPGIWHGFYWANLRREFHPMHHSDYGATLYFRDVDTKDTIGTIIFDQYTGLPAFTATDKFTGNAGHYEWTPDRKIDVMISVNKNDL